jgi:hypothetical protein
LLDALTEFQLSNAAIISEKLKLLPNLLDECGDHISEEEQASLAVFREGILAIAALCDWSAARRIGLPDASAHLTAAKEAAAIVNEKLPNVRFIDMRDGLLAFANQVATTTETGQIKIAADFLAKVPVPPFLIEAEDPMARYGGTTEPSSEVTVKQGPFVIRLMMTVDGRPWANPQVLTAGLNYDLRVDIMAPNWPNEADRLVLDVVTTLPPEEWRISPLVVGRSSLTQAGVASLKGHISFPTGQSFLSEPLALQMRATFLSSTQSDFARVATIVGFHKLLGRISDPKRTPSLSKYPILDQRIVEIIEEVRDLKGMTEGHLEDFITALSVVVNYMGIAAQQALYRGKEKTLEKDFQRDLLIHMRGQLGEEVQEAPKVGRGITDIVFRSITLELKVEEQEKDRAKMLARYQDQTAQYVAMRTRQLGLLCVLDLTKKDSPPAPPQNNIVLLKPELHGFSGDAPYPVRIAAIVIDGNLLTPSSYSA